MQLIRAGLQGYHVLAAALFLPALLLEPRFLAMALAIAAAAFIAVEILRVGQVHLPAVCVPGTGLLASASGAPELASLAFGHAALLLGSLSVAGAQVPVLGPALHDFMTAFIDSRDRGLLLVSHFSLLLGMAAPVWLSLAFLPPSSCNRGAPAAGRLLGAEPGMCAAQGREQCSWQPQEVVPAFAFAGIVILGAGDSAASALGRRLGRTKVLGTQKTVEGTLGGTAASLLTWAAVGWACSCVAGWGLPGGSGQPLVSWGAVAGASLASCLLEVSTTQLDNIFLPLHHFAWLAA